MRRMEAVVVKNYVVTISRGYGSGGRYIGKLLARRLGIGFYDRELISLVADDDDLLLNRDESVHFSLGGLRDGEVGFVSDDKLFNSQSEFIKEIAAKESCVIVGRCADYILRDMDRVARVFIHSSLKNCMKRVMRLYELNPDEARQAIILKDKSRSGYYEHYTGQKWNDAANYDLSVDSGILDSERCVELIREYVRIRFDSE